MTMGQTRRGRAVLTESGGSKGRTERALQANATLFFPLRLQPQTHRGWRDTHIPVPPLILSPPSSPTDDDDDDCGFRETPHQPAYYGTVIMCCCESREGFKGRRCECVCRFRAGFPVPHTLESRRSRGTSARKSSTTRTPIRLMDGNSFA